jgi:hypothetical protein
MKRKGLGALEKMEKQFEGLSDAQVSALYEETMAEMAAREHARALGYNRPPFEGLDVSGAPPLQEIARLETSVFQRFSPRRRRWRKLDEFDERIAELEARQARVQAELTVTPNGSPSGTWRTLRARGRRARWIPSPRLSVRLSGTVTRCRRPLRARSRRRHGLSRRTAEGSRRMRPGTPWRPGTGTCGRSPSSKRRARSSSTSG